MYEYEYHNIKEDNYKKLTEKEAWGIILNEYKHEKAKEVLNKALKEGGSIPVINGYISQLK